MSDVYKGIALPWGPDINSFIEPKDDADVIKSSIIFIITTRLGERVMLPEFGSALFEKAFEPGDTTLIGELKHEIVDAIRRWDDRVEVIGFSAEADENVMRCKVVFQYTKDPLQTSEASLEFDVPIDMVA